MGLMDPDYSPEDQRKGVSPEQHALIVGNDNLDRGEQCRVLDLLSAVATGDVYWPLAEGQLAEEMGDLYGLAQDAQGLWRDAMVLVDGNWVFDPASVL